MYHVLMLAQAGGQMDLKGFLPMIAAIGLIFYFLVWRPQSKQVNEQKAMLASLKKGDEVVTQGGMLGKIYAVTEKVVTLEVANGVRLRVLKTSIQGKAALTEDEKAPAKAEEKEEK
jgi:preprotein translocase subunit YajC